MIPQTVDEYLSTFRTDLASKVTQATELRPIFDPRGDNPGDPRSGSGRSGRTELLLRDLFPAQADVVEGLARVLASSKAGIVVGEMGTGKTTIGAALPFVLFGDRFRALVIAPGHLVPKWEREIRETVPRAEVHVIRGVADAIPLMGLRGVRPNGPTYYILSRDRAKLGYFWRPAVIEIRREYGRGKHRVEIAYLACPQCGGKVQDGAGDVADLAHVERAKRRCAECREALWQADGTRVRRYAPADFIKRRLKGFFDLLIGDEVHQYKAANSAQANAFGALAAAARKVVALTGTLAGGYADDLFHLLFRMRPDALRDDGFKWGSEATWLSRYGALETVIKRHGDSTDLACSRGKRDSKYTKRLPGISPLVFSRHLISHSAFIELADVAEGLPPFEETSEGVVMNEVLHDAYKSLEDRLRALVRSELGRGSRRHLGAMLHALWSYPDTPFRELAVEEIRADRLSEAARYPKEAALLKLVGTERAEGRRVWVYVTYTGLRDVSERLRTILRAAGHNAEVLSVGVEPEEREEWIRRQVERGVEVVVSNARLVETGLDLLDFPTLVYVQTGYSVYTLRQSSRRSWRIGQTLPVRVRYLYYRDSIQDLALRLMGKKIAASTGLEGKFSSEGLAALAEGDVMTALAKALAQGLDDREIGSVESYWRGVRRAPAQAPVQPALPAVRSRLRMATQLELFQAA